MVRDKQAKIAATIAATVGIRDDAELVSEVQWLTTNKNKHFSGPYNYLGVYQSRWAALQDR